MELVSQSRTGPSSILMAAKRLVVPETVGLRVAVAYTTGGGVDLLLKVLDEALGRRAVEIDRALITSFDFMHTEPNALRRLMGSGFDVRISRTGAANFHPKVYVADHPSGSNVLVGSANLSRRAFTTNAEAAIAVFDLARVAADEYLAGFVRDAIPLDDALLERYEAARAHAPRAASKFVTLPGGVDVGADGADSDAPVSSVKFGGDVVPLRVALDRGVEPTEYRYFWVECGTMSGGSRNQVELPRGAHRFFGHQMSHERAHEVPAELTIIANGRRFNERKLTWHGSALENQMERLNLPTRSQGGYDYSSGTRVVLFVRSTDGYRLELADVESDLALAWRNASAELSLLFRVGRTERECGFF